MSTFKNVSSGYIFYDNLGEIGNTHYWTSVYNGAESYFSRVEVATPPGSKTAGFLYSSGMAEFEKEKQLLSDYFGVDSLPWTEENFQELIRAMNIALNIEAVFARVVDRLTSEEARAQERDTVLASVYGECLDKILQPRIESFFSSQMVMDSLLHGDSEGVGAKFEEMVKTAMDDALDTLLSSEADPSKGDRKQIWAEALDAINSIENFRRDFGIEFFSRYGFNSVKQAVMEDIKNGLDYENLKEKVASQYQQKISGRLDLQTTAGYVAERLGQAFQAASTADLTWSTHFTSGSRGYTTDKVTIMGDGEVDFTSLTAKTKMTSHEKMRVFHNQMVRGMKNTTIIYENTKKYNLGKNFSGFHGGTRPLESIGDILSRIGYANADGFINKIKQTMPGAILDGSGFKESAEEALAAAVGYLLFDDMDTIGNMNSSVNAVHIFRLSDIILPLSFLLIKIAEAMNDAEGDISQYVNVSIGLPGAVDYSYPQEDKSMEASIERWNSQAQVASGNSTITINFLSGFKSIIGSLF